MRGSLRDRIAALYLRMGKSAGSIRRLLEGVEGLCVPPGEENVLKKLTARAENINHAFAVIARGAAELGPHMKMGL